ncbi:phycobilisome protein [Merismopedia glauca]|uniref:Phycobilisome protein n=1 Tax=Merismopedia glauca CCAP 1448/3 TaxID=1296344 RepID=A0A2T1BXT6_9CYAN|nr:phycobilisome protein [Merismopedia glauca]PSB00733.1 phycobilisome protein [Merismopedia glauca CCAP 1448/3]
MLTQLKRLSIEADGRYASPQELQFCDEYFQSLPLRLSAYQKLKESADEIIALTELKMRAIDPKIFINSTGDFTPTWKKDIEQLVRYAAAALLFNDSDRLNEGLLIWHSTIAKSYKFDRTCKRTFQVMPEVMREYLSPEEFDLLSPLLSLNGVVLG